MEATLERTPLHGEHVRLGAKLVPFAGYEMPVQYPSGITAEHRAVREAAGLFDVSHMGEFIVSGAGALDLIQRATVNDVRALSVGQAQYSAMCRPNGGIIDDLLVYRFRDHWMLVVNSSNREKDWDWLSGQARGTGARLEDRSDETALLALQGPRARRILAPLADIEVEAVGYYRFTEGKVAGRDALIAGTGYTGEDGFELYLSAADAVEVWGALLDAGAGQGLVPAGLGARDSLRLEMGYALYGNDLDEEHTPLESGLGWITKLDKGDFVGRDALIGQKQRGVDRKLVGLKLLERGFPRPGYEVLEDAKPVGIVTSGTVSPTLGVGVAMAWVPSRLAAPGTRVDVSLRGKPAPAEVVRPPFHTGGSIRK
jgi:aminomethyltransferase